MNDANSANSAAREAAYAAIKNHQSTTTSIMEYRSRGRVLVIGSGDLADGAAFMLPAPLSARILRLDDDAEDDVSVVCAGRPISITGHLGQFVIHIGEEGDVDTQILTADLILDLGDNPQLTTPLKPPGYLWNGTDPDTLETSVEELGELVGTFEKPRYFDYDAAICAHGRSGQAGCNRCIEACPAEAITGLIESIEVDPYRCQGGGMCATVCPSGAIRYAYPQLSDSLERIRQMLRAYLEAGGSNPVVAFVAEADANTFNLLPDNVLMVELEELGSVGIEVWLSTLAFGARQVALLQGDSVLDVVVPVINEQVDIAQRILAFLGYGNDSLVMVSGDTALPPIPALPENARNVSHAPMNDKRNMLFAAIDTLAAHLDTTEITLSLPSGAPFGQVLVDSAKCTLCMGCTSVCPAQALVAGGDSPRLIFHEMNCVQCGICETACPENAISLDPRLNLDIDMRRRGVTLHEETPFTCVECGKPFATRSAIDLILGKLKDHPMFATERARRRLKMCDDCRVMDVVQDDQAMNRMN
ncbi:MAG: (Fe-S)-binding protein [marine bacterium B5-7]|nr:MAG: (Fe-S)-binding protein [marine bacterium B5-7]